MYFPIYVIEPFDITAKEPLNSLSPDFFIDERYQQQMIIPTMLDDGSLKKFLADYESGKIKKSWVPKIKVKEILLVSDFLCGIDPVNQKVHGHFKENVAGHFKQVLARYPNGLWLFTTQATELFWFCNIKLENLSYNSSGTYEGFSTVSVSFNDGRLEKIFRQM